MLSEPSKNYAKFLSTKFKNALYPDKDEDTGLESTRVNRETVVPKELSSWAGIKFETLIAPPEFAGGSTTPSNPSIPAGYTYLGQFLIHDLMYGIYGTKEPPTFNLGCLYGQGPEKGTYLYRYFKDSSGNDTFRGVKFHMWQKLINGEFIRWDMPRGNPGSEDSPDPEPIALIPDSRNDRNFIISQLHCVWALFHNAVVNLEFNRLSSEEKQSLSHESKRAALFAKCRKIVLKYYRHIIVTDYLERIVDREVLNDIWNNNRYLIFDAPYTKGQFKRVHPPVLMPEFMDAAFRFGHTQIREFYLLTWDETRGPFGQKHIRIFETDPQKEDLRGFKKNKDIRIDWRLFFDFGIDAAIKPQRSKAIDPYMAFPLGNLPFLAPGNSNLIHRDAQKSKADFNPGKVYADVWKKNNEEYELEKVMEKLKKYCNNPDKDADKAPLWLYLLVEAEMLGKIQESDGSGGLVWSEGGRKLGPIGERIVAEQMIWALKYDVDMDIDSDDSINTSSIDDIRIETGNIKSNELDIPATGVHNNITMADLIKFADF